MISCRLCNYDCAVFGALDRLEMVLGDKELLARPYSYEEHMDMDKAVSNYLDYGGFRRDAGLSTGFRACGKCRKTCTCHDLLDILVVKIADKAFAARDDSMDDDYEYTQWIRGMADRFAMHLVFPPMREDRSWDEILHDVLG